MKKFLLLLLAATIAATSCDKEELPQEKETPSYTVTFDSQGGTAVASQTVEEGGKVAKPADPTKSGFFFVGWYKEVAGTNAWNFDTDVVTANVTLYAKWTTVMYTVTFETNGGSAIAPQQVAEGAMATRPNPSPTKSGAAFDEWYRDSTLNNAYNFSTPVMANTTLYAGWKTVTLDSLMALLNEAYTINSNNYTYESWDAMYQKRQAAEIVAYYSSNPTPEQIIIAYTELKDAIAALELRPYRPAVAIEIYPNPADDIFLVSADDYFNLSAYAKAADGSYATNEKVTFTYNLAAWVAEYGQIYESDNNLSFPVSAMLTSGVTTTITIRSVDNPAVSRIVTLRALGEDELKAMFLAAVAALPAPAQATTSHITAIDAAFDLYWQLNWNDRDDAEVQAAYQKLATLQKTLFIAAVNALPAPEQITRDHIDALSAADDLYWWLDWSVRSDAEVQAAYEKLEACWEALMEQPWELTFTYSSFSGNVVMMTAPGTPVFNFTYTSNGAFPNGTYLSAWMEEDGEYGRYEMVLNSDLTFGMSLQFADNAAGSNPSAWIPILSGTYTYTGSQATGGTLSLLADSEDNSRAAASAKSKKIAAKALKVVKK